MKEYEWTPQEIREYDFICEWQDNHDYNPTYADAIAWADKHPNWIKVNDRLPMDGQICLIVTKMKCCFKAKWSEHLRVFLVDHAEVGYYKGALTHWLPIELPIEEDEE